MELLNEMTDEQLALSYIDGNNRAFDLLLSRTQSKLFTYIMFVVRDQDVANDIFQETFVKVIVKLKQGKYTNSGKFSAWLVRIAHNVIMDWYREQKSEKIVEPTEDNEQVLADVKKMMNMLPPSQREVVFMRFYQEMSFKEIAEATNVSINTALGRMRYAILNLRRMAKQHSMVLQLD